MHCKHAFLVACVAVALSRSGHLSATELDAAGEQQELAAFFKVFYWDPDLAIKMLRDFRHNPEWAERFERLSHCVGRLHERVSSDANEGLKVAEEADRRICLKAPRMCTRNSTNDALRIVFSANLLSAVAQEMKGKQIAELHVSYLAHRENATAARLSVPPEMLPMADQMITAMGEVSAEQVLASCPTPRRWITPLAAVAGVFLLIFLMLMKRRHSRRAAMPAG